MKVTTSKAFRQQAMKGFTAEQFESEEDFFYFIHLNNNLRLIHSLSFVLASIIFIFSLIELSWKLFVLQYFVSTLPAVASHYWMDGYKNKSPVKTPLRSLRLGVRLNLNFLLGKTVKKDKAFIEKYPFVKAVFQV